MPVETWPTYHVQIGPDLHTQLERKAKWAAELLEKLRKSSDHELKGEHIREAKGLAFFSLYKAGVLLSAGSGHAFLVKKLPAHEDGIIRWSAPVFLTAFEAGIGATIGAAEIDTVLVINNDETLQQLSHGDHFKLNGANLLLPNQGELALKANGEGGSGKPNIVFKVKHGLLVADVGFSGVEITFDTSVMKEVYPGRPFTSVLQEWAPAFPAFQPLYNELASLQSDK